MTNPIPYQKLFVAGFIATFVVTIMGYPALAGLWQNAANPITALPGWTALLGFFLMGTFLFPMVFMGLRSSLPGSMVVRGLLFGLGLAVVVGMTSIELISLGMAMPSDSAPIVLWVAIILFHLIYGAILGALSMRFKGE